MHKKFIVYISSSLLPFSLCSIQINVQDLSTQGKLFLATIQLQQEVNKLSEKMREKNLTDQRRKEFQQKFIVYSTTIKTIHEKLVNATPALNEPQLQSARISIIDIVQNLETAEREIVKYPIRARL